MLLLGVTFQKTLLLTASIKQVLRKVARQGDDPFPELKSSIDQLPQSDENLVPNYFICKDVLTVEDNIAVMEWVRTDEEISQDIIEVVEEELQEEEEEKEGHDKNLMKLTTEEIRKTIDTLKNF